MKAYLTKKLNFLVDLLVKEQLEKCSKKPNDKLLEDLHSLRKLNITLRNYHTIISHKYATPTKFGKHVKLRTNCMNCIKCNI